MIANTNKTRAFDILFAIATDTAIAAADRVAALNTVLFHSPEPILGSDRFEITTAGEAALAEAEALADSVTPAAEPAEEPTKRKRRTKAEIEAARAAEAATAESTAESAEQIRRAISDTPEDRQEPAEAAEAEDVHQPSPSDAEPEVDWDAPAEPEADTPAVSKTELIALLNRYAAKHPKKAAGAKEVLSTYAGTESLSAVDPSDYGAIATAMRTYLEAA